MGKGLKDWKQQGYTKMEWASFLQAGSSQTFKSQEWNLNDFNLNILKLLRTPESFFVFLCVRSVNIYHMKIKTNTL